MGRKTHIPFNKGKMTFQEMEMAIETFEDIINRWHQRNKQFANDEYDLAEFFWEVAQQIHHYTTRLNGEKT
jgi:hypothetical protein